MTTPHTQEQIELLSQAKAHGNIFAATGGMHLTANNIFKGIVLNQPKLLCEKNALIHELPNIDPNIHPPIPAPELIVDSITNAIGKASDMSGNVVGIVRGKGGV